ncbi:MAG: hypothetical protein ACUVTU_02790 [Desulfurispora sp.]|uniref:hypothetical protein n=1 Tax=Desulfurispora sp. TaxID=3014275 RepID=UPI00404A4F29
MANTVLGVFPDRHTAERAVNELRSKGFEQEISIVARDEKGERADYVARGHAPATGMDSITNGVTAGGAVGGLLGLAAGVGALAIPGIGPVLAAGPLAGFLTGAATGGLAGGLADYGIPAERGRYYEEKVKQGNVLVSVRCDHGKINEASDILRRYGASDVETH